MKEEIKEIVEKIVESNAREKEEEAKTKEEIIKTIQEYLSLFKERDIDFYVKYSDTWWHIKDGKVYRGSTFGYIEFPLSAFCVDELYDFVREIPKRLQELLRYSEEKIRVMKEMREEIVGGGEQQ